MFSRCWLRFSVEKVFAKISSGFLHFLTSLLQTTTKSLADETKKDKIIEKDVTMLANLKWSDTDNFYMNLGCHKGVGLVVCGDDKVR